ncbi:MAG TPA: hypothetical protein VM532_10195 [Burkholderiales bacterium]|nr:hypothetical protein [Burkholderiales bacterium]
MSYPIPQRSKVPFFPVLGFLALALASSQEALASHIDVCRSGCPFSSIQEAINSAQPGETIRISPGFYKENIVITDKSLTLKGEDSSKTVINGSDYKTVVTLECTSDQVAIRISGVSITGGVGMRYPTPGNEGGGMIVRQCKLSLDDSEIYGNHASGSGGGIGASGDVSIKNSSIFNNQAGSGAGIQTNRKMLIVNSTISNNTTTGPLSEDGGAGIHNRGDLIVKNSTISNNVTSDRFIGGGIHNRGSLTLIESTLANNGGGAIGNQGDAVIIGSLFTGNTSVRGGVQSLAGTLSITDSLVLNNSGGEAGGILNREGTVILKNTTVANNTSSRSGGGITNYSALFLKDSLITGNTAYEQGGGLYNAGSVHSINTTITGNTPDNCSGVPFACP